MLQTRQTQQQRTDNHKKETTALKKKEKNRMTRAKELYFSTNHSDASHQKSWFLIEAKAKRAFTKCMIQRQNGCDVREHAHNERVRNTQDAKHLAERQQCLQNQRERKTAGCEDCLTYEETYGLPPLPPPNNPS